MKLLPKILLSVVLALILVVGGKYEIDHAVSNAIPQVFGATGSTPIGGVTYYLAGAGVNATANTIQLASFLTPDGRPITTTMLGGIAYGALEPGTSKLEDITFNGVTQNANGTAILTGVTRGNDFVYPYAASTTLAKAHAGGASFILTNTAGFYQQFLSANNNATSTATLVFSSTTPPLYDFNPVFANFPTTTLASVSYVNTVAIAGAPNSSETVNGIGQLATGAQAALGTSLGSTLARLFLPSSLATSTPGSNATNQIPITIGGKLAQTFFDLTQVFTWSGLNTFTAGFISTASSTASSRLNISASDTTTHALTLNGVAYQWPSSQGALNTSLVNNGSGVLSWVQPPNAQYSIASTSQSSIVNNKTITSAQLSVPAGVLTASSTATMSGVATCITGGSGGGCTISLIDTNSNTYCTTTISPGTTGVNSVYFSMNLFANSSPSSQSGSINGLVIQNSGSPSDISNSCNGSVNWANATNFEVRYVTSNTSGVTGTLSPFTLVVRP